MLCYAWQNVAGILEVDKHTEFFKIQAEAAEDAATAQSAYGTSAISKGASCYYDPDQM